MFQRKPLFSSQNDNWKTPQAFYKALDAEFRFNCDPCPTKRDPEWDGLTGEWGSISFVNPPYSDISRWVQKSYFEWIKGKTVIMLIPSRTDTKWWHEWIMHADEIRFIRGRLKFGDSKKSAPFPSAIVIFKGKEGNSSQH